MHSQSFSRAASGAGKARFRFCAAFGANTRTPRVRPGHGPGDSLKSSVTESEVFHESKE